MFWTAKESQAAANWVQQLPEGSMRNLGLNAYAQAVARPVQVSVIKAPNEIEETVPAN